MQTSTNVKRQTKEKALRETLEFWDALVQNAGLQTAPRRDGTDNYDTKFLDTLRRELVLPAGPIRKGLQKTECKLEALLSTVLLCLQPWSRMMRDVLEMLNEANATNGGDTIELSVQLEKTALELRETLEHFKRQTLAAEELVMMGSGRRWGEIDILDLSPPDIDLLWDDRKASPLIKPWLERLLEGDRSPPPLLEPTGYQRYDDAIRQLQEAMRSCLRASRIAGKTTPERSAKFKAEPDRDFCDGWRGHRMVDVDSDRFVGTVLNTYDALPRSMGWNADVADKLADHIFKVLSKAPVVTLAVSQRCQQLMDLLALPIWRKRHELYSVWIAALVRRAARKSDPKINWKWHVQDGVLSFAFSGAIVAELECEGSKAYFWAELRRKAMGQSRKGRLNVQPDYTLVIGPDRHESLACLVVECKQYRRPSGSNFTMALEDYAAAHEFASVALFNYGPVGVAAIDSARGISEQRNARVTALGNVWPDGAGIIDAEDWLATYLSVIGSYGRIFPKLFPAKFVKKAAAAVTLTWADGGDLDLHLVGDDGLRIFYGSRGSLEAAPWMQLDGDLRQPGTERAVIASERQGSCTVEVHLYSGDAPAPGTVTVNVSYGEKQSTFRSRVDVWPRWTVCTIDLESGTIR